MHFERNKRRSFCIVYGANDNIPAEAENVRNSLQDSDLRLAIAWPFDFFFGGGDDCNEFCKNEEGISDTQKRILFCSPRANGLQCNAWER